MFDTACNMLDSIYNKQYIRVTNYITEAIEFAANKGLTECIVHPSKWGDICPLVLSNDLVNELILKGYSAEVKGDDIVINWRGAERNCLFRPHTSYSQVHPQTTVGDAELC